MTNLNKRITSEKKEQRKLLRTKAMMNLDLLEEIRAKKTKQMAEYRAKMGKALLETDILPDNTRSIPAKKAKKEQKQCEDDQQLQREKLL